MGSNNFSTGEQHAIFGVSTAFSVLSLIGALSIIFSYYKFPKLRKFSFKLVLFMSITDGFSCISYFLGSPTTDTALCTLQGFLQQLFQLSSILWTTAIATTLYRAVVKQTGSQELLPRFHLVCSGIPALFALLPLLTSSYGNTAAWCWIFVDPSSPAIGQVWRLLLFYLPLWAAVVFNGYTYYISNRAMRGLFQSSSESEIPKRYRNLMKRLNAYPLILAGCWFFATINRIQNAFAPNNPVFVLYMLQVVGRSLQGTLNAIAYGLNENVREEWATWLQIAAPNNALANWYVESANNSLRIKELDNSVGGGGETEYEGGDGDNYSSDDDDELTSSGGRRKNGNSGGSDSVPSEEPTTSATTAATESPANNSIV